MHFPPITARSVKKQGRDPVARKQVNGWICEVYRVGKRHEFQALATDIASNTYQTQRIGGPGAQALAMDLIVHYAEAH